MQVFRGKKENYPASISVDLVFDQLQPAKFANVWRMSP